MMWLSSLLEFLANFASVVTAVVAVLFFRNRINISGKRASKLLEYLKQLKTNKAQHTQRSTTHLMARLGFTEEQVFQAALDNKLEIMRRVRPGPAGDPIARDILFEYDPESAKNQETYE